MVLSKQHKHYVKGSKELMQMVPCLVSLCVQQQPTSGTGWGYPVIYPCQLPDNFELTSIGL